MTATVIDATPFTIAQFALMAAFAVLVIAGMLYGRVLKRRRLKAEDEIEEHREAVVDGTPTESPALDKPETAALAPSPIADQPAAAPAACDVAIAPAGDITQLKGLGPKLATTLAGLGITRVDQIAAMSPAELDTLDAQLGAFKGRPARDRWAEQARLLTVGDRAAYEAEFGKLGA